MTNKIFAAILIVFGILAGQPQIGHTAENPTLKLTPSEIQISAFYDGATVNIESKIPADAEALVIVRGESEDLHYKKKGKAGGLLWMNIGDIIFHNVPKVYMIYASKDVAGAVESPELNLGFGALEEQVSISPENEDKDLFYQEFLKLKQSEGLYAKVNDGVHYGAADNGMKSVQAVLSVPARMRPGAYTVELFAVRNKAITGRAAESLQIKQVGFPAQLTNLAFNHALWHGIMAVVVALLAGLFMGVVFKDKGGAH
jgi:hypothetical protein